MKKFKIVFEDKEQQEYFGNLFFNVPLNSEENYLSNNITIRSLSYLELANKNQLFLRTQNDFAFINIDLGDYKIDFSDGVISFIDKEEVFKLINEFVKQMIENDVFFKDVAISYLIQEIEEHITDVIE